MLTSGLPVVYVPNINLIKYTRINSLKQMMSLGMLLSQSKFIT